MATLFNPYRELTFGGNGKDPKTLDSSASHLLLHAPHCAVKSEDIQSLMATLEIPSEEWPSHFELFCFANGDQGSEEYTTRVAEILTSPEEVRQLAISGLLPPKHLSQILDSLKNLSVTVLLANCHRSILDLNRMMDYAPTDSSKELTPPVPGFIEKGYPRAMEIASEIHQAASAIEERCYAKACAPGNLGVLNTHTYMPINPQIQNFDTLYQDIYDIFSSSESYQNHMEHHKRPDVELITARQDGKVVAPTLTTGLLVEKLQHVSIEEISLNIPYRHVDSARVSQWAMKYPGKVSAVEISRDLFLEDRRQYRDQLFENGALDIQADRVNQIASAIAAAYLMQLILEG